MERMSFILFSALRANLDYEDGWPVVADPGGHFRQALIVGGRRVQEAPVLSVLQQKVRVDEQDAEELKFLRNLETFTFRRNPN